MAPAATIVPLTVTGLMMPAKPCEIAVTLKPERDEPTWPDVRVNKDGGREAKNESRGAHGAVRDGHQYLDGTRSGPIAVDQEHVVRRELELAQGVSDLDDA